MPDFQKLFSLHRSTTSGEWDVQSFSNSMASCVENGVSIQIGDDSLVNFVFGGGWSKEELIANANFMAIVHNEFPAIAVRLEQANKMEQALKGLLAVISHYETGFTIDRNCFDQVEAAETALASENNNAVGDVNPDSRLISDDRYPYTYACDYLREAIGDDYGKGLISRSAASKARSTIAEAVGVPDEDIAKKLAFLFLKNNS